MHSIQEGTGAMNGRRWCHPPTRLRVFVSCSHLGHSFLVAGERCTQDCTTAQIMLKQNIKVIGRCAQSLHCVFFQNAIRSNQECNAHAYAFRKDGICSVKLRYTVRVRWTLLASDHSLLFKYSTLLLQILLLIRL